jgi:predicted ATPase
MQEIGSALKTLGLTSKVDAKQINDVQIELRVGRSPSTGEAEEMVSIADVGFGVSQTLPVLVALLVAEPGQLVYLEQPEIHLHPRAQAALAEILADAAKRGVRVVVETHSELLLLAVQSLVAEGKISPDLVKLHWFTRRENGVTEVSSAELDEAGAFGDWPEDFGDVSLKLESRYLDAAEKRLWQRSHGS